jgi:hypothetical protein
MRCNCTGHVHSFACFVRNIATDGNSNVTSVTDTKNVK